MTMEGLDIRSMTISELENMVVSYGENRYRGAQLFSWFHEKKVQNYDQMTNISKAFREKLKGVRSLMPVEVEKVGTNGNNYKIVEKFGRADATAKYGALLSGTSATSMWDDITAATYNAANNYITMTMASGKTVPVLKEASVLCANSVYGIEPA